MAVCSKCGVTVQDQNLQPDAEGKLVCRTCAGAWRAKSGQLAAAQARQESSPGFWMPLALAASALCVLLLIIAISAGLGKSSLRKDKDAAESKARTLQSEVDRLNADAVQMSDERERSRNELQALRDQLDAKDREIAELKVGKKPKTAAGTSTASGSGDHSGIGGSTGAGSGIDLTGATDKPVPPDAVFANAGGKNYHLKTCKYYGPSSTAMSVSEAKKKGLTPCRFCKPPSK